jgi:hypothetical protein
VNNSERKHHTPEEKVSILRRHLIEKVPVSNLCEEFGLHPTVFYRWLKQFFENGAAAFQNHRADSGRPAQNEPGQPALYDETPRCPSDPKRFLPTRRGRKAFPHEIGPFFSGQRLSGQLATV